MKGCVTWQGISAAFGEYFPGFDHARCRCTRAVTPANAMGCAARVFLKDRIIRWLAWDDKQAAP